MSDFKGTPGPWTEGESVIKDADGATIASLVNKKGIDYKNRKANAKLIAASPDLLDAALYALDCLDYKDHPDVLRHIKNAIAKATS